MCTNGGQFLINEPEIETDNHTEYIATIREI